MTGASEGIGRAYALELAKCGYNIKIASRSVDKLDKVAAEAREANPDIKTEVVPLDVTKAHPSEYGKLFNEKERVAIVVNNAGIMKNQKLLQMDPNDLERMIKTNVHPYIYMTKYALPHFISNADSQSHRNAMIYVSSSFAYFQAPFVGPYCGTKIHNLFFANMIR